MATAEKGKPAKAAKASAGGKIDLATIAGLVVAVGGIMTGLLMEGGKVQDVKQVTAAIIVLGGTIGAVMVTTPQSILASAVRRLISVFVDKSPNPALIIDELIRYATKARKEGIVALEQDAEAIQDPFLRKAMNLAVDGTDLQQLRKMMELEISLIEHAGEAEAKVYEAAGGYAPTVGIIGAVLGLIQVMKNLENIEEVGKGIAVAFVATVYGVGVSNLFFLPVGQKLKGRLHQVVQTKELMLEGVIGIVEGLNPKLLRTKLEPYAASGAKVKQKAAAKQQPAAKAVGAET
jgi:chemotaxis protein MotA